LGAGNRGANVYGNILSRLADVKISAVCDVDAKKTDDAEARFGTDKKFCFYDENAFFDAGVLADGLVVASMDRDHYRQVMRAIDAGYKKILLEKPVSDSHSEVAKIAEYAKEKGVDILVAHVLRYTAFYKTIKDILRSGVLGRVAVINHQENVAYWHFAHSFTRGNWRDKNTSAPILLAKTCHDFDLLYWFAESKCIGVESFGELTHFRSENAPAGCAKRCMDGCKYMDECPFSVKNLYLVKKPPFGWGNLHVFGKNNPTAEEKTAALKNPENPYGRCVYFCDNNVEDHLSVAMKFQNGATATLTLTAFSKDCYRKIHIMGTKGELFGNDYDKFVTVNVFGQKKPRKIRIKNPVGGHLGGDNGICDTFYKLIKGEKIDGDYLTTIDVTAESHNIIFEAEKKRKAFER
jgi:predicted dehydrogenase